MNYTEAIPSAWVVARKKLAEGAAPYLVPLGRLPLVGRVDGEALEGVRIHSDDGELVQSSGYVVLHLRLASEV